MTSKFLKTLLNLSINALITLLSALFLVLIAGVLLLTYSRDSREWLLEEGLPALLTVADMQLEVSKVDSPRLSQWQIHSLYLSNKQSPMLALKQLHLEITDASLFSQGLDIHLLQMDELNIHLAGWQITESRSSEFDLATFLDKQLRMVIQTLRIDHLSISGLGLDLPDLSINGGLWLDLSASNWLKSDISLQLDGKSPSLVSFQADMHEDLSGLLTLSVKEAAEGYLHQLTRFPSDQAIDASLSLNFHADQAADSLVWTLNAMEFPWYQHPLSFKGQGHWHLASQRLWVEQAELSLGEARASVSGELFPLKQTMNLDIHQLSGPLSILELFSVDLPDGLDIELLETQGTLTGSMLSPDYAGALQAKGAYQKHDFRLQGKFSGNTENVTLEDTRILTPLGKLATHGLIDWHQQQLNLTVKADSLSSELIALSGVSLPAELQALFDVQGNVSGEFSQPGYSGMVAIRGDYKGAHLQAKADIHTTPTALQLKTLTGELIFQDHTAEISAEGLYSMTSSLVDARIRTRALPLSLIELIGLQLPESLNGQVNSDISLQGSFPIPRISGQLDSQGVFNGEPYQLEFSGLHDNTTLTVSLLQANWMNSMIEAEGTLSPDLLGMNIKLENMQTEILNSFKLTLPSGKAFPQAQVDMALNLSGTAAVPELQGFVRVAVDSDSLSSILSDTQTNELTEKAAQTDTPAANPPVILQTDFDTENQLLSLQTSLTQNNISKARLDLQTRLSPFINRLLQPNKTQSLRELPIDIKAKGSSDLAWLNDLLEQDVQHLAGKLNLDVHLQGNINQPEVNGTLELLEGSYRNAITQSRLDQIQLMLEFDNQFIQIREASARDGERGQIRLEGGVDLTTLINDGKDSAEVVNLKLYLEQASLIRRDDIEGEANGQLALTGNFDEMTLSGNLQISPFQILLDRIPKDSIPEIEVQTATQPSLRDHSAMPTILLDVSVDVDQQAFIRGRGLDAELQGKLSLSGTLRHPTYTGKFQVIRGTVDLLAKTFKLEQGDVLFSNDAVSLFARARHKTRDLNFIASLEGTLDNLKISLTTEPSLPQDEALSRLLFGKSVRDMTPVQAIQLANAIQTLRGESGAFDPLGAARDILQVDRITIESQETTSGNGVAIGLGKYITDKVYVELTRTPEPAQPWKGSVEMELTPNLNLETTSSGSSSFDGVELQWKKDY